MSVDRQVKLTYTQVDEITGTNIKKTLSFGYIKDNIAPMEVIDLGNTILNSACYDFVEFVGASIVESRVTKLDLN